MLKSLWEAKVGLYLIGNGGQGEKLDLLLFVSDKGWPIGFWDLIQLIQIIIILEMKRIPKLFIFSMNY